MFEQIPEEVLSKEGPGETMDPCIVAMREGTDEAKKVIRNGGSIWHSVFQKVDLDNAETNQRVHLEVMKSFL